jgi:hypothetical protein
MCRRLVILCFILAHTWGVNAQQPMGPSLSFFGDRIILPALSGIRPSLKTYTTIKDVLDFPADLQTQSMQVLAQQLLSYKQEQRLDDWLFYQLIRTTAEQISPKQENYHRYTLYKWALLNNCGYSAVIRMYKDTMLLYTQSNEVVYDIPFINLAGKQYVCLNYHDYGSIDFEQSRFQLVLVGTSKNALAFSYKINQLPNFSDYPTIEKAIKFDYRSSSYDFKILVNKSVQKIFSNYPTVDYPLQFSIPLSKTTYESLIPALKKILTNKSQKQGIDYLMHLTRSAFAFENDAHIYGKEKRLSAEQTLLYDYSDCEDRAAFFFCLVKEIYHLPMIVLSYPAHITVAVKFDQPMSNPIVYNGASYWVCEPSPQKKDLPVGKGLPALKKQAYEVVYAYNPH